MEEMGNNNAAEPEGVLSKSFANIPAPTAEVKVRTMRADLESLAATGGGLPRFNRVNVEGLSISRTVAGGVEPKPTKKSSPVLAIAIIVAVCAVLAIAGLLFFFVFSNNGSGGGQNVTQNEAQPISQSTTSPVQAYNPSAAPPPSTPTSFTHASFFKIPADQVVTLSLSSGGMAQTASQLQTYDQQVLTALTATTSSANFIEIDVKGNDGHDLSIEELFSQADAGIIDPNFLASHFNSDATFFAYRDTNGLWPGYVMAVLPGENQASLKSGVQAIESSSKIGNVFLAGAGIASPSGFGDAVISGAQVRILNFTGPTPAAFVYGWFQNYFIVSASREGFAQAVAHLQ